MHDLFVLLAAVVAQEELSSLVAILHEFAADMKLISLMDNFDTNKDGKVSFGTTCTLWCAM
jgi:Ca2+-binding EF-hand superfamily protein